MMPQIKRPWRIAIITLWVLFASFGSSVPAKAQVAAPRPAVPTFRNHVLPILTKALCNSGACHGAAAGKGGLKLTLRGFDPEADYNVLVRQAVGRRVLIGVPKRSLLVLKPTMRVGHGGGVRIKEGSPEHKVLAQWISAGAPGPKDKDPTVARLEVVPLAATLKLGDKQQVKVRAHYSDGSSSDVTRWVKFGTSDSTIAVVSDDGLATVAGAGEAAVTIWYANKVAFARIISPYGPTKTQGATETGGTIDRLVDKKLAELGLTASPAATDAEFIRRATLDAAGVLPTRGETEAFLKDERADKRTRLIDSLLARPEYVDYWTYKWSDLLLVSSRKLEGPSMTSFYNWIRASVETNKPWDKFAREIITATGSTLDNGAANFYSLHKEPIALTETTTQAFLGMSVQCAHCHNHPMEKWTQRDYYQMANLFGRVRLKAGDRAGEVLILASKQGDINHPRLGRPLPPRPLDGTPMSLDDPTDRREKLAEWLTSPQNVGFSKALVNRIWKHLMGRGLVESEDDLRLTNPPSNQELFDALAAEFTTSGYDVKALIRTIMHSRAYQRSSVPVGLNAQDNRFYSRFLVRRLPAEVLLDGLSQVTGAPTEFAGVPKGTRALQLKDSVISTYFLAAFGRPERQQTCSCERQQETSITQALHLANGDTLNTKLRASGGMLDRLISAKVGDDSVLDEIMLSAFSREPTQGERARMLPLLATAPAAGPSDARRAVLEDLLWAVLTDREFLFNH